MRPIEAARLSSVEALGGAREAEAAVLAEAGRLPGLGLEPGVELGRVLGEPGQVLGRAQLADQPGRMPGRARGQLLALEQQHVRASRAGQVVGDRAADHPAADDHRPGMGLADPHGHRVLLSRWCYASSRLGAGAHRARFAPRAGSGTEWANPAPKSMNSA